MKIAILYSTEFPPEEGIGNYVLNLSKNLVILGNEVVLITRGKLFNEVIYPSKDITVIKAPYLSINPFHLLFHQRFVNKELKKMSDEIDIIHINEPLVPNIIKICPILSTIHTSIIQDATSIEIDNIRSKLYKYQAKFISYPSLLDTIEKSDCVTTVANSVKEEISLFYNYKNTYVIGNGVDIGEFYPQNGKNKENYILFVGRLDFRKGIFDLLESWKIVISQNKDCELIIVGKGPLEKKIREFLIMNNIEMRVKLFGFVSRENLVKLYQNAKICVIPSHYEGLPTVLLEAMACGLPVISTEVSGSKDVIKDNYNGMFVPTQSPEKLAFKILYLLNNENLQSSLGYNARKTVEAEYSWNIITKKFLYHYTKIL